MLFVLKNSFLSSAMLIRPFVKKNEGGMDSLQL